ncbi:MAG: DUF4919 domain-containing protein [Bacteroidetes bacterium]|nr:DUF4919 domain-containing protein [Bacteroidota bacterium]
MNIRLLMLCAAAALCAYASAHAQQRDSSLRAEYDALVERLKHNDTTVDFASMRRLLSKVNPAAVTGGMLLHKPILDALQDRDMKRTYRLALEAIDRNYLDVRAHILASIAAHKLGNDSAWKHHRFVFGGIIRSILGSGDGETPETAYEVISVDEEYATLSALGLEPRGQSIDHDAGHTLDVLKAMNPDTKAVRKIYFNADIVLENERRAIEQ